jgi:hypothetical protein
MRLTRSLLLASGLIALLAPLQALAQEPYDIVKSEKAESFTLPYTAANVERGNPLVYTYDEPKGQNWILTLDDKLEYVDRNDSKIVVMLKEAAPSEKFIQVFMHGGEAQKFAVAVNTPETGYQVIYEKDVGGWVYEEMVTITHGDNRGLTVTDGKRIVVDRLGINGFDPASVEVYGKDEPSSVANAFGGTMIIGILYGSPADTPIFWVPAGVMIGVGALVGGLLLLKKRK